MKVLEVKQYRANFHVFTQIFQLIFNGSTHEYNGSNLLQLRFGKQLFLKEI